jgi:hypothetical protein
MLNIEMKRQDEIFGDKGEEDMYEILCDLFECEKLFNTKEKYGKWCPFDFEDREKSIRIELKSRRIKHNKYDGGAMIPYSKIVKANEYEKEGGEWFFVFNCVDGIFYCRFDKEFLKLEKKDIPVSRGGIARDQSFLPFKYLSKVEFEDVIED